MEISSQNQSFLLGLFGSSGAGGFAGGVSSPAKAVAPTPPWNSPQTKAQTSAAVTAALAGHKLIDENAAKLDLAGASADYRKLFALYHGLGTLTDIATQASAKSILAVDKARRPVPLATGLCHIGQRRDEMERRHRVGQLLEFVEDRRGFRGGVRIEQPQGPLGLACGPVTDHAAKRGDPDPACEEHHRATGIRP